MKRNAKNLLGNITSRIWSPLRFHIIFSLLFLSSMASAACMYDSNLGTTRCFEEAKATTNRTTIYQTTPEIHLNNMIVGLMKVVDGKKTVPTLSKTEAKTILDDLIRLQKSIYEPVENATAINLSKTEEKLGTANRSIAPIASTKKDCLNERKRDWQSYCAILWSQGMLIDCDNANTKSKDEILDRLANSTQSEQYRCLRG